MPEQENSAGKENCSLLGQGEAKAVRREGFESWHSSACCSPAPVCAQLSVESFGCRGAKGWDCPPCPSPAESLQWDGLAPVCGRFPQRAPMPLKAGIDPCKDTRAWCQSRTQLCCWLRDSVTPHEVTVTDFQAASGKDCHPCHVK